MRILYFTSLKEQNESNMSQWQINHFINELRDNEWSVDLYFPENAESIEEINEQLIKHVNLSQPDMLLSVFNETLILPSALEKIRSLGVFSVLICFDNLVAPFIHKNICKYFDLVWLTSKETEYLFKHWGANTIFMPYAANPKIMDCSACDNLTYRMAFVGTPYGARKYLLNQMVKTNVPLDIYGTIKGKENLQSLKLDNKSTKISRLLSFPIGRKLLYATIKYRLFTKDYSLEGENIHTMQPVSVLQVPHIYNNYALSLSSTSARNTEVLKKNVPIVNLRSFEIPMSYGLQLCRYNEELSQYFEEDKEILFYRDEDELVDKVKFYTNEKNDRIIKEMKLSARKRAEKEHTWMARFKKLIEYM